MRAIGGGLSVEAEQAVAVCTARETNSRRLQLSVVIVPSLSGASEPKARLAPERLRLTAPSA